MNDNEIDIAQSAETSNAQAAEQQGKDLLQKELELWKDKALRAVADLNNMRRRTEKERQQWKTIAQGEVILPLLSVIDDVERAMKQKQPDNFPEELRAWFTGFGMIHKAFEAYLKKIGIEKIVATREFDPALHESIGLIHSDLPAGSIAQVVQEGYLLNGSVIRPTKVLVADQ